jgi:tRNA pseudouridine55 synthase
MTERAGRSAPVDPAAIEDAGSTEERAGDLLPGWFTALLEQPDDVIPLLPAGTPPPRPSAGASPPKSGILVLDKPGGITSFDAVRRVRSASGERRVGHAGTLDPMATGVLVVCLGSATRVVEAIQEMPKTYAAEITLGASTSTYDAEGDVVATRDTSALTPPAVAEALRAFQGGLLQVPPMVAAVKHDGERLYDLARRGVEVEREARPVTVYDVTIEDIDLPLVRATFTVSKGTYIRSIAHDLGVALGVGAHLSALRRTAIGRFTEQSSHTLEEVEEAFADGWWPTCLRALDEALLDLPALVVADATEAALRNGRQIAGPAPKPAPGAPREPSVRVYGQHGRFVGLATWDPVTEAWQPERIFPAP